MVPVDLYAHTMYGAGSGPQIRSKPDKTDRTGMDDRPLYTRERANELLAEVTERLARLRQASAHIAGHRITAAVRSGSNGGGRDAGEWLDASRMAAAELTWFGEAGIVVRDIQQGLADFPAEREGQEIYLCWRLGEKSVDFWHGTDTGFANRQPL
jgi:hypothetical protein